MRVRLSRDGFASWIALEIPVALSAALFSACFTPVGPGMDTDGGPTVEDAGTLDAGPDAGADAGTIDADAGQDAGPDAGSDAGPQCGLQGDGCAPTCCPGLTCQTDTSTGTTTCQPPQDGGSDGFACPNDPTNHYPGGPSNPNLGYFAGQTFPDIALGSGYWNLTTGTPVLDTASFYQDTPAFHDLYCSEKFKVALLTIVAGWCTPCNHQGQDLATYGAPTWLPEGGIILGILGEGAVEGSRTADKSDLDTWIGRHSTNYPLVLSSDALIEGILSLPSWPTSIMIDMKTMNVLDSWQGYVPCNAGTCDDTAYSQMAAALK